MNTQRIVPYDNMQMMIDNEVMIQPAVLRSIDNSIKRLSDAIYDFQRTTEKRLQVMETDIKNLQQQVNNLQTEAKENKAELKEDIKLLGEHLEKQIEFTNRRIDDINASQNKWFTLLGLLVAVVPIAVTIVQSILAK